MSKGEFVLRLLHEGREWAKLIVPALITWHLPQPRYMRKQAPLVPIDGKEPFRND